MASALRHFQGTRYFVYAYVVMNNHVHVLVRPLGAYRLEQITHSWKSFTANRLKKESGRAGWIWQNESFDRIVRDEEEFWRKAQYILANPVKRWPGTTGYRWAWLWHPSEEEAGTEARSTEPSSEQPDH